MAVRSFATNNLVEDHDNYVKFMKIRWGYLSKEDKNTDILFYKKGLVTEAFGIKYSKEHKMDATVQTTKYIREIKLWHSITIAYNLWCNYAKFYIDRDHSSIQYKQFVDFSEDVLKKIKFRFEQIVKNAKCEYKTNGGSHLVDPCRLLAMYWTYLDLIKDTKTQRYFPNNATCERAVKVFGYKKGDNPFILNGKFSKNAIRDVESPMDKLVEACDEKTSEMLIEDMEFSYRTYNALKRHQINTFGDLLNNTISDLMKIRNFGLVSLKEVVAKLKEYGYSYPKDDEDSWLLTQLPVPDKAEQESVIDIAEQAAKEVEEEKPSITEQLQDKYNALCDSHEKLSGKYDALLAMAQEQTDNYDKLLKEKMNLENYNSRLRDEISDLKDKYEELTTQSSKLRVASDPKNLDTFTLLNIILEKMRDSKMEYILLTIDGMTIDIHPAKSFPLRSSYQIRSSEVR